MTTPLHPVTLTGSLVRLEPLSRDHHDGLVEAINDGDVWDRWYTSVPQPDAMAENIDWRLAQAADGQMLPFAAIRQSDGAVLGMTTYYAIDPTVPRLEIGYTWNRASAHGTGTNPESKLLLLEYAFDTLGCECVGFKTQWSNHQSREAIARLGAKQDGVLRSAHRHPDGTLQDSVVFSILRHEWPTVRSHLRHRLRHRIPMQ